MLQRLLLLFILGLNCWSADLHLFNENGDFNDEFSKSIFSNSLKKDEKIFLDNKSVVFKDILGSGNTTLILRVLDPETNQELALRLPHGNEEKRFYIFDAKRFINHSFEGYEELKQTNLPIPKIHSYKKDSYLLVDLIEHNYTLRSFLDGVSDLDEITKSKAVESLIDFSKKTALYDTIGDFHFEQLVYSSSKNEWFLLDWTSGHQLARLPSSPIIFSEFNFSDNRDITDFDRELYSKLKSAISEERTLIATADNTELESLKKILKELTDKDEIINVYRSIENNHLASFYIQLQKDFIDNQLQKFPSGALKKTDLTLLLDHLGKFTPFYFSQFTEKILSSINDLETFMILYKKINTIGFDEDLQDDISMAITRNLERILSNTEDGPKTQKALDTLKEDYAIINYRARQFIGDANQYLKPSGSCNEVISVFL